MTDRIDPMAARRELGQLLRALRTERTPRLSQTAAAEKAGPAFTQTKVARLESGARTATPLDVGRLAHALGASRPQLRRAISLARDAQPGTDKLGPVRAAFTRRPGLAQREWRHRERDAHTVRTFHPVLVPGLLQSEAYMRAVYRSARAADPEGEDEFVRERAKRPAERSGRPTLQLVTEGALCWGGAGVDVMVEQCAHIAHLTQSRPTWEIGVIPRALVDVGRPVMPVGGFDVYDDTHVVLGTDAAGVARIKDVDAVARYLVLFEALRALAVYGADARRELARIAEDYQRARTQ